MKKKWKVIISQKLLQSKESLEEAKVLLRENKSNRSVMNRLYYSMLYAVLALLQEKNIKTSSHSGARNLFGKEFIKTSIFEKNLAKLFHKAFDLRIKGDYKLHGDLKKSDVNGLLPEAEDFVKKIEEYLLKKIEDNDIEDNDKA